MAARGSAVQNEPEPLGHLSPKTTAATVDQNERELTADLAARNRRDYDEEVAVRIRVLGGVGISTDAGDVALTPQLRLLVGLLVTEHGSTITSERLGEYLAPDGATHSSVVRTAVSRLRKLIGDRVETASGGYRLRLEPDELDATKFLKLCDQARTAPIREQVDTLEQALELWTGPAFGPLAGEEWARSTSVHLDEARAVAVEDLAEALIGCGQPARAAVMLKPHVADQPYRERPVGLLMRALGADGRVADALREFQRFDAIIRDEIGIDPSSDLRRVESELLAGLGTAAANPGQSATNLPNGTVTFLFTDIEGSTSRWQDDEAEMSKALTHHDQTIASITERHGGHIFKHTGDGICAVFSSAKSAVDAAIQVQADVSLPVRIGLHTGEAEQRDGDYFGPTLNRTARVMDAGHGGQTLMSIATASLSPGHGVTDHGHLRLKGLSEPEHVFQVGHHEFPPLRVVREIIGNLPVELTSFVGRSTEISRVADTVIDHQILTLTGVGGTGKTRLAVEASRQLASAFPDGCWMVELAPVATAEAVPAAFARGVGIHLPKDADVVDIIVAHLRNKRALVIVDNCEHVLTAAADVIELVAAGCPSVSLLSTSREPLMLNGEHLVPVAPLAIADAVELFNDRASAEDPDFSRDDVQSAAVEVLCARLDGLPLAVELAASRIRAFTPVELQGQLEERFRLLVGGRRSRMERHQTMRSTLDWSYDLCDRTERAVFDRLSVWAAKFDLGDARVVAAGNGVSELEVIDTVPRLVDKSLLQRSAASDGTTRYLMLETMRAYGREHLQTNGELTETWNRYAEHVAMTVGLLSVTACGPDEEQILERLDEYALDAPIILDWLAEHRAWNLAARIAMADWSDDGLSYEMAAQLNDWLLASGDHPPEEGLIERQDHRRYMRQTVADHSEIGWQALRTVEPVPEDWLSHQEVGGVMPTTTDEAEELFRDTLRRYGHARPIVRAFVLWTVLGNTLQCGLDPAHVEGYAEAIEQLERLAADHDSKRIEAMLESIRGQEARGAGRYPEATAHFDKATRHAPTRRGWFYLYVNWNAVSTRALSGETTDLGDVAKLWQLQEETHMAILNFRAALGTALALDAADERPLSKRFFRWFSVHVPEGYSRLVDREIQRFEAIDLSQDADSENLDALIADLQEMASAHRRK
ncbi:hypothetical protein JYT71_00565 [Acidimicrobiaceae bacterium AH-315-P05]|nr:hypothetical protein [Acidimicrobiaceae bacterium AH-315-P05]